MLVWIHWLDVMTPMGGDLQHDLRTQFLCLVTSINTWRLMFFAWSLKSSMPFSGYVNTERERESRSLWIQLSRFRIILEGCGFTGSLCHSLCLLLIAFSSALVMRLPCHTSLAPATSCLPSLHAWTWACLLPTAWHFHSLLALFRSRSRARPLWKSPNHLLMEWWMRYGSI